MSRYLEYRGSLLNYDDVRLLSAVDWDGERGINRGCRMRATFERSGDPGFIVFPGADHGNEIPRVENADPVET